VGELVLIHGVALGPSEFQQMAAAGSSLVWSPLSNLLLYGQTADVAAAKAAGVHLTLAPDWSPSGSKSPLHELKVADLWDDEMLGDLFTDYELVEMVTSGAAKATNWQADVGTITPGTAADLVVVDNLHANPYRNLINAVDPDVRLSIVGGLALYGDEDLMTALKGDDHEPAGRFDKVLDVTFLAAPEGAQTWASITENLTLAMRFDVEEMTAAFGDASDFESVTSGMTSVGLDPWYTYGDERYFSVLNGSQTANAQIDMSLLYDRYYDRVETLPEVVVFEEVQEPTAAPCSDGSAPPCTTTGEEGGEGETTGPEEQNTNTDDEENGAPTGTIGNGAEDAQGEEENLERSARMLLLGVVVILLLALYIVSKGGEDALAAEVRIEKMWDETTADDDMGVSGVQETVFIPAPPPLAPPMEEE
jgi:hypothetical protein